MSIQQRRARERDERRERIIAAARQLAEAEGWDAVTTRRLADAIEYSQPVLYSHFQGKEGIIRAVAEEGFGELAGVMRAARLSACGGAAPGPAAGRGLQAGLLALGGAYLAFARDNPAVYEAMFTLADLPFARPESPASVHAGFEELSLALAPLAGDRDLDTLGETTWSTLHGLATLTRNGRLRAGHGDERLALLVDQVAAAGR